MVTYTTRALEASETAVLEQATLGNMNWIGERFTLSDIRERREFSHYTRLVPDRGDFGLVAEADGRILGVAWSLFLPADDPGYGFINAQTPEISLWVSSAFRGQGIGRALLRQSLEYAIDHEIGQISLSVEEGNFAKQLYLSEGFKDVPGEEANGIMLRSLS